ncbi:ABC transporter substrate-binding protein [Cohnella faecalis]|uniref:ABC transporter substrate-binding protein n=1 Tax=Cohnella faecalis TaxID=2315694 RepID=UPI0013146B61|nr:sugar ABC transporter substrate-binding protein [Cohnella faecalis]
MTKQSPKKVVSSLLLTLVIVLLLSACSSKSGTNNAASPSTTGELPASSGNTEKVEINWVMAADPDKKAWQDSVIASFEASHPNIKVHLENIPYDQFDQKLTTMISSGNAPDVWNPNQADSGFATYMSMGAIKDLTPYIEKGVPELETMDKDLLNIYRIDGKYYGIPLVSNATYLFYNKDLFDAANIPYPTTDWDDKTWTYDKMLEIAQKLTHDVGDIRKQVFGFSSNLTANAMAWSFGGDFFKPEAYTTGVMGEPDLSNPKNVEALQYNLDLIEKYKVSPDQQTVAASAQLGDVFMTGKVGMFINGGWGLGAYEKADFKWGVAAVPYKDGRKVTLYVDPWSISASSKHPDEAWEFVRHLANPAEGGGAYKYMNEVGRTPADSSLFELWYEKISKQINMDKNDFKQVHEGSIKYGREAENHLIVKFNTILETMNQTMSSVWNGRKTLDTGLKEMDQNLRSLNLK